MSAAMETALAAVAATDRESDLIEALLHYVAWWSCDDADAIVPMLKTIDDRARELLIEHGVNLAPFPAAMQ